MNFVPLLGYIPLNLYRNGCMPRNRSELFILFIMVMESIVKSFPMTTNLGIGANILLIYNSTLHKLPMILISISGRIFVDVIVIFWLKNTCDIPAFVQINTFSSRSQSPVINRSSLSIKVFTLSCKKARPVTYPNFIFQPQTISDKQSDSLFMVIK